MCDFPSWKRKDGEVLFLTDKEARTISDDVHDVVGHYAIDRYFNTDGTWDNEELVRGHNVPPAFVKAINEGACDWMMTANGYKHMHLNKDGKLHREDGPAVEYADGYKAWWISGEFQRSEVNNV